MLLMTAKDDPVTCPIQIAAFTRDTENGEILKNFEPFISIIDKALTQVD